MKIFTEEYPPKLGPPPFQPITIVLETYQDAAVLGAMLAESIAHVAKRAARDYYPRLDIESGNIVYIMYSKLAEQLDQFKI